MRARPISKQPDTLAKRLGRSWIVRVLAIAGAAIVALSIALSDRPKKADPCGPQRDARQKWIDSPVLGEGLTPAFFHMSSTGACGEILRVREDDCSFGHLIDAYGSKRFMLEARDLGFAKISCGYDEFELSLIMGAFAANANEQAAPTNKPPAHKAAPKPRPRKAVKPDAGIPVAPNTIVDPFETK